jgi:hypothetical protein
MTQKWPFLSPARVQVSEEASDSYIVHLVINLRSEHMHTVGPAAGVLPCFPPFAFPGVFMSPRLSDPKGQNGIL